MILSPACSDINLNSSNNIFILIISLFSYRISFYFPFTFSFNWYLNSVHTLFSWPFSGQFTSVAHLCPTLCDTMNHSLPGLPVHHLLLESTQTHVHCVSDAIQPSHPLLSPSPPALNLTLTFLTSFNSLSIFKTALMSLSCRSTIRTVFQR